MHTKSLYIFILVFCVWIAAFSPASGQQPVSLADLIADVEPSVVRIETSNGIGSGFVATDDGIVVTNLHVLAGSSSAKVRFIDGRVFSVIGVLATDEERDLAIVRTAVRRIKPLRVATVLPRKGTAVVTFGAPAGLSFSASEGIVSAIRSGDEAKSQINRDSGTWLQTTAPISPGNSGGPLVDRQGQVIGVNTFYVTRGQNLNFAISSLDIAELLRDSRGKPTVPLSVEVAKMSGRPSAGSSEVALEEIIRDYLKRSESAVTESIRTFDKKILDQNAQVRALREGRVNKKLRYSSAGFRSEDLRGKQRYFYFSDEIKDRMLKEATKLQEKLTQLRSKISSSGEGLVYAALAAGPNLSLTRPSELGRVDSLKVVQVLAPDEFHGSIGGTRVVVKGVPTKALLTSHAIRGGLFVYTGAKTYRGSDGREQRLAVLTGIPNSLFIEVGKKVTGSLDSPAATGVAVNRPPTPTNAVSREWSDMTGSFKLTAEFVKIESEMVYLKQSSGKMMKVPLAKLSLQDKQWLRDNAIK